ncbi:hypothetical protein CCR75_003295 [Bremia lactucae]|uniref:Heme haloperoxidase family profile domain-containing protein n=1 Tax=Bremia lactucae TaxID=4779 RepID=A0A976ILQ6_BRELC|nr:hypothetical protein CCR75_003295 [Bremia lactucae]
MVSPVFGFTFAILAALSTGEMDQCEPTDPTVASGVPGNTMLYHRGPCPALNTLANCGYLNYSGQSLTRESINRAIVDVFNQDIAIVTALTASLKEPISLSDLSRRALGEHDGSLVHLNSCLGIDPMFADKDLFTDLINRGQGDKLCAKDLGEAYLNRRTTAQCYGTPPITEQEIAQSYAQGSGILTTFGTGECISKAHATAFLLNEVIPSGWTKRSTPVTADAASKVASEIKRAAEMRQ